jgi:hypothetical protein
MKRIMKKSYIIPATEMTNLASQGIMQNPSLSINVTSTAPTIGSGTDIE